MRSNTSSWAAEYHSLQGSVCKRPPDWWLVLLCFPIPCGACHGGRAGILAELMPAWAWPVFTQPLPLVAAARQAPRGLMEPVTGGLASSYGARRLVFTASFYSVCVWHHVFVTMCVSVTACLCPCMCVLVTLHSIKECERGEGRRGGHSSGWGCLTDTKCREAIHQSLASLTTARAFVCTERALW